MNILPPPVPPFPYKSDRGITTARELDEAFAFICANRGASAWQVGDRLVETDISRDLRWAKSRGVPLGSTRTVDRILRRLKRDDLIVYDRDARVWRPSERALAAPDDNPLHVRLATGDGGSEGGAA